MSNFTSTITVDFTGTSYDTGSTFRVESVIGGSAASPATGVSKSDLESGYTYTHAVEVYTPDFFRVISENTNEVCAGSEVGFADGGTAPEATATPTPTPTETPVPDTPTPTPGATATPTPTPFVQQWASFVIDTQGYSNEFDACTNAALGTTAYFTSSIGTSFTDLVNYVDAGNPVTIYSTNNFVPGTEITGSVEFHAADATGPAATYAFILNSSGIGGGTDRLCSTAPTPTPVPETITITAPDGINTSGYDIDSTGSLAGLTFTVDTLYTDTAWIARERSFPNDADPQYPEIGFTITTSTSGTGDGIVTITVPQNNSGQTKRSVLDVMGQVNPAVTGSIILTQDSL